MGDPALAMLSAEELSGLEGQGYFVRTHWIGEALALEARAAAEALHAQGALRPAGLSRGGGHRLDAKVRGDCTAWLDAHSDARFQPLLQQFEALRVALNQSAYLGLSRFAVQLARYPGLGEGYDRHRDAFATGAGNRRVTAIIYLNPAWQPSHGGALRLFSGGGTVDIPPVLDQGVVFLSDQVEHEVLPALAPRVAVTAWYYGSG